MKPNPFLLSNHLTLPLAITCSCSLRHKIEADTRWPPPTGIRFSLWKRACASKYRCHLSTPGRQRQGLVLLKLSKCRCFGTRFIHSFAESMASKCSLIMLAASLLSFTIRHAFLSTHRSVHRGFRRFAFSPRSGAVSRKFACPSGTKSSEYHPHTR